MANKYSEELFGAIDEILRKRFETLNKDTTILCTIEDASKAEDGQYIVSNNSLRFTAYSENTKYMKDQNVWVLIPDGDYNNTKMIIGKYVSTDTSKFTWVDPFSSFINMTGDLVNKDLKEKMGLTANSKAVTERNYGNILAGLVSGDDRSALMQLRGLDRIAVSADFATQFAEGHAPISGDYGLKLDVVTDKKDDNGVNNHLYFYLNVGAMEGNVYGTRGNWYNQRVTFDFDPAEQGNVIEIYCTFYQNTKFLNNEGYYNLDEAGLLIVKEDDYDIFIKDLTVMLGFSNNVIKKTTALLSTSSSSLFNLALLDEDKKLYPRFVYKNADGSFTFINVYNDYKKAGTINSALKGLKLHLYYQDLSKTTIQDPRAGVLYRESWERDTEGIYTTPEESTWLQWERSDEFINNFEIDLKLDNTNRNQERIRIAFCFKKNTSDLILIQNRFEQTLKRIKERHPYILPANFEYYDNDLDVIQVMALNMNEWYKGDNILVVPNDLSIIDNIYYTEEDSPNMSIEDRAFWNYIIYWICRSYYYNGDIKNNVIEVNEHTYQGNDEEIPYDKEINYSGEGIFHAFTRYLIENTVKKVFVENPYRNFEKAKYILENVFVSNDVVFTNSTSSTEEIQDLIQGLRLVATDTHGGIYNLYKATTNANSELIRPGDANTKRSIELSFNSYVVGDSDLDKAERIFWLMPKNNTMIKEPTEGVSFGTENYNILKYTKADFETWIDGYTENSMPLYVKESSNYLIISVYEPDETGQKRIKVEGDDEPQTVNEFFKDVQTKTLYSKTKEYLIVPDEENFVYPEGTTRQGYKKISELTVGPDIVLSTIELNFLNNNINNYWVILEDRTQEEATEVKGSNLKKASLTYQIKSVFRKTLTNNKIYAGILRNGKIYTNSIELFFGVKGTNGTNYTLSITPIEERYGIDGSKVEATPNVWTAASLANNGTGSLKLKAVLYDTNDKDISSSYTFDFQIYKGRGVTEPVLHSPDFDIDWIENSTTNKIIEITSHNGGIPTDGIIIRCIASLQGTTVSSQFVQYYILPIRTSREYAYLDGPDTIIYDSNKINPDYYNVKYSLKKENEEDKDFDFRKPEIINYKIGDDGKHLPKIDGKEKEWELVPKANYVENESYNFSVWFKDAENENVVFWKQPILVVLNNYTNTSITEIGGNTTPVGDGTTTVSSVMSSIKRDEVNGGRITGIVIGGLPSINLGNNQYAQRAGVLGYLQDYESYGFLDDGTAFLGNDKQIKVTSAGSVEITNPVFKDILPHKILAGPASGENSGWATFRDLKKADITDFPATMPPAQHSHTVSEITDFPSSMPPTSHTHTKSQITDFAHTHTIANITDFPSTMPPTAHSHGGIANDGTITSIKINGVTYNVGTYDDGTRILLVLTPQL